ncbi:MAG: hypothetical protein NTV51_17865 [Verrucomicrobia bacterium]|nr:hypothetical protein [Verrucomicrobiota bacterium]
MSFNRADGPVKERGDFGVGETLLIAQVQGEAFVGVEVGEGRREIGAQVGPGGRRGDGGFGGGIVLKRGGRAATAGVAPVVVGDAEQPGGKGGAAVIAAEAAPRLDEGFLREIVGEGMVAACEVTQKLAYRRLMALHQQAERRPVLVGGGADNQFGIAHERAGGS